VARSFNAKKTLNSVRSDKDIIEVK
jgi:hypothetical protein